MLALALTGCGQPAPKNNNQESSNKKISVVATIFPQYDFVRAIAGDNVDISMLLPPGAESHSFEPTPQDIIRIQNCDIFIYVGGESDQWVEAILSGIDTSKMTIITLMSCVQTVEEEIVEGMQNEDDAEDSEPGNSDEPEYDEHVWTSPLNAKMIVEKISSALCEADTANAKSYQDNTAAYLAQLDNLDAKFKAVVSEASRTELIFGDRFPFRYFVDEYGLKYYAAFPGCAAETEASPATIKFLIDKINEDEIPVVFHIEMSNEQVANTISEATGAKVLLLHACHNISQSDFSSGKTYLELMTANAIALKEALG
jgi:zinc transport system substrate-binding protein